MKKINIKGDIISNDDKRIYDWLGMESTCPQGINKILASANHEDIEIDINSGGGDIFAGSEIYTALRNYEGNVKINIVGLVASAASVIAMAGKSQITPTGLFMIHNVHSGASGDYRDIGHMSEVLKTANKSIANAYKEKTGLNDAELLKLMDNETWMSAGDAVENKFVDGLMFEQSAPVLHNSFGGIPHEAIAKIRNEIKNKPDKDPVFLMQAKLKLLKLKGEQI